jgi:hypothetical protein
MFGFIKKIFGAKEETTNVEVPYKVEATAPTTETATSGFNYEEVKPKAVVLVPVAKEPARKKPAPKKAPAKATAKRAPAKKAPKK